MRFFGSILCWLLCTSLYAQQPDTITISGTLISPADGYPIPGATIRIKDTNRGVSTDFDGNYTIDVPVGATLVISSVGYTTYEVKVTRAMGQKAKAGKKKEKEADRAGGYTLQDDHQERGVAILSDSSATYFVKGYGNRNLNSIPTRLSKIKRKRKNGQTIVEIVPGYIYGRTSPRFNVELNSALSLHQANRLPELQQHYAQGRAEDGSFQYNTEDLFSWGPALENRPGVSQSYDHYRFFRPAWSTSNQLKVSGDLGDVETGLSFSHASSQSVIPNSDQQNTLISLFAESNWYAVTPRVFFQYSKGKKQLPVQGANLARVLGSLYSTPPSFDLLNGQAGKEGWNNRATYLTEGGQERSFAPGKFNHPYWLLNGMPDQAGDENWLGGLKLRVNGIPFLSLTEYFSIEGNRQNSTFGYPVGTAGYAQGLLGQRLQKNNSIHSRFDASTRSVHIADWLNSSFSAGYFFTFKQAELSREYEEGFNATSYSVGNGRWRNKQTAKPERALHELTAKTRLFFKRDYWTFLEVSLGNQFYFSDTQADAYPFLPQAHAALDLKAFEFFRSQNVISNLELRGGYSQNVKEASLLSPQYQFATLGLQAANYQSFFPGQELVPGKGLRPEMYSKWDAELDLSLDVFSLTAVYFREEVQDLILPVYDNYSWMLRNTAALENKGWDLALRFSDPFYGYDFALTGGISFGRVRSYVKEIYGPATTVPIAGFQDVSLQLTEGERAASIVGSQFERSPEGELIINADGFPQVASEQGIVGNTNPDWTAGGHLQATWRDKLSLYLLLDARHGGDIWNGTGQFLNYYGTSQATADDRTTTNYIFPGVSPEGLPNTRPVDFYDPALPLDQNRWVRYGPAGVAEEATEEASWLRINEISLGYDFAGLLSPRLNQVLLRLSVRNLLLSSSYSGIDPVQPLFGYAQAQGLDLFNMPNTRSYGCSLTINF